MNILITGCNGQLGNEMQLLEKENPQHMSFIVPAICFAVVLAYALAFMRRGEKKD